MSTKKNVLGGGRLYDKVRPTNLIPTQNQNILDKVNFVHSDQKKQ